MSHPDARARALRLSLIEAHELLQAGQSYEAIDICRWLRKQAEITAYLKLQTNVSIVLVLAPHVPQYRTTCDDLRQEWHDLREVLQQQPDGSTLTAKQHGQLKSLDNIVCDIFRYMAEESRKLREARKAKEAREQKAKKEFRIDFSKF